MARILLLANLNSDHILKLQNDLHIGHRHLYTEQGRRLGGGGANTGIGLAWAGHDVALITQVGTDETANWLIAQASDQGLDCRSIQRYEGSTAEVLILTCPKGERTILRPDRPLLKLTEPPNFSDWDLIYFNIEAQGVSNWCHQAVQQTLVVSQLKYKSSKQACHYLIASHSELPSDIEDYWEFAVNQAGDSLKAFIVTHAEQGATAYTAEGMHHQHTPYESHVVDTTGAGDVYAAGFMCAILNHKSLYESMIEAEQWAQCTLAHESSIPHQNLMRIIKENKS